VLKSATTFSDVFSAYKILFSSYNFDFIKNSLHIFPWFKIFCSPLAIFNSLKILCTFNTSIKYSNSYPFYFFLLFPNSQLHIFPDHFTCFENFRQPWPEFPTVQNCDNLSLLPQLVIIFGPPIFRGQYGPAKLGVILLP
jgi:hypothetical protein